MSRVEVAKTAPIYMGNDEFIKEFNSLTENKGNGQDYRD